MILAKNFHLERMMLSFSTCPMGLEVFLDNCSSQTSREVLSTDISTTLIKISTQDTNVILSKNKPFVFKEIDNILSAILNNMELEESERHNILTKAFSFIEEQNDMNTIFATFENKPTVELNVQNETVSLNFLSILPKNLHLQFIDSISSICDIYLDGRLWKISSSIKPIQNIINVLIENLVRLQFLDSSKKLYITKELTGLALKSMLSEEAYRLKSILAAGSKPVTKNEDSTIALLHSIENLSKKFKEINTQKYELDNILRKVIVLNTTAQKMPNIIKRGVTNLQKHFC